MFMLNSEPLIFSHAPFGDFPLGWVVQQKSLRINFALPYSYVELNSKADLFSYKIPKMTFSYRGFDLKKTAPPSESQKKNHPKQSYGCSERGLGLLSCHQVV